MKCIELRTKFSFYLAEMCNVSTSYYNRIFKKKFNTSPKQYILAKKLNYAMDLLATTNISITDISEMSGFSSLYYFSKIFKNYYNISPQNYRESHSDKLQNLQRLDSVFGFPRICTKIFIPGTEKSMNNMYNLHRKRQHLKQLYQRCEKSSKMYNFSPEMYL